MFQVFHDHRQPSHTRLGMSCQAPVTAAHGLSPARFHGLSVRASSTDANLHSLCLTLVRGLGVIGSKSKSPRSQPWQHGCRVWPGTACTASVGALAVSTLHRHIRVHVSSHLARTPHSPTSQISSKFIYFAPSVTAASGPCTAHQHPLLENKGTA